MATFKESNTTITEGIEGAAGTMVATEVPPGASG